MIESRERKSAFLREAVRALGLTDATVANARFEDIAADPAHAGTVDQVTVRAVKIYPSLLGSVQILLKKGGRLLLFRPPHEAGPPPDGFAHVETVQLTDTLPTYLSVFNRL